MDEKALDILNLVVLVGLLGIALYTDLKFGKIYNKLTFPCIVLGMALNTAADGWQGLLQSVEGMLLVLIPFLFFAPLAGIGGGDIKLMTAVGALLGLRLTVWAVLYSAVIGGVLALVVMARYRALLATTRNVAGNLYLSAVLRAPTELSSGSRGIKFRYTPAIALGTLLVFLLKG